MQKITLFLGALLLVGAGVSGIAYIASQNQEDETRTEEIEETHEEGVVIEGAVSETPRYTIEAVPYTIEDILPNLNHQVVFGSSVPQSIRPQLTERVRTLQNRLKGDHMRADDWYDLAIYYHTAQDLRAAEEVWLFLTQVVNNNGTAYDNLGKLYHYDLKNFPKSEEYFKKSITVNPSSVLPYLELHMLYRYSYKQNTSLAVDILNEAAKKFPADLDALTALGAYYRDKKDTAGAREAYLRAMDRARALGEVVLLNSIGEELARLPQQTEP